MNQVSLDKIPRPDCWLQPLFAKKISKKLIAPTAEKRESLMYYWFDYRN